MTSKSVATSERTPSCFLCWHYSSGCQQNKGETKHYAGFNAHARDVRLIIIMGEMNDLGAGHALMAGGRDQVKCAFLGKVPVC